MKIESQSQKVLSRLQSGHSITPLQAIRWWGCMRLARVINDLRNAGHEIETELVGKGQGKYAKYSLK